MLRAISRALFVLGLGTTGLARPAVPAEIETGETIRLTARRRQSSFQQLSPRETESGFETTIASRKKEAATVIVRENFPGDWTLIQSSIPGSRRSARVVEFAVPVPAGGQAELTYRVRVRTGR